MIHDSQIKNQGWIKFIFLFIILAGISSCADNLDKNKVKEGDLVYLKPDSTLVSVSTVYSNDNFVVIYLDKNFEEKKLMCKKQDLLQITN